MYVKWCYYCINSTTIFLSCRNSCLNMPNVGLIDVDNILFRMFFWTKMLMCSERATIWTSEETGDITAIIQYSSYDVKVMRSSRYCFTFPQTSGAHRLFRDINCENWQRPLHAIWIFWTELRKNSKYLFLFYLFKVIFLHAFWLKKILL